MENKIIYLRTKKSEEIRDKVYEALNYRFKQNPARVRDINNDKDFQQATEKMLADIIIDYKHPIFKIRDNKIYIYQHSIVDKIDNKVGLENLLITLDGKLIDDNDKEYNLKEIMKLKLAKEKIPNFKKLISRKPDLQETYFNQTFYLGNNISIKVAALTQKFFKELQKEYPDHIIDIDTYINDNLMTPWLLLFIPQVLILFGQSSANSKIPILFNIPNMWSGTNTPAEVIQFISKNVPNKWILLSTYDLIKYNFDFIEIQKHMKNDFNLDKNSNNGYGNIFEMYFLSRNLINTNNKPIKEAIEEARTRGVQTIYPHSKISLVNIASKLYYFEIANLSDLNQT